MERNSLQAAYSGALWVGAAAVYVQVLNGAGNFIGQHIFNPKGSEHADKRVSHTDGAVAAV